MRIRNIQIQACKKPSEADRLGGNGFGFPLVLNNTFDHISNILRAGGEGIDGNINKITTEEVNPKTAASRYVVDHIVSIVLPKEQNEEFRGPALYYNPQL